ncbi:ATP-dependent DNA helicase RecQ [Microcoleus sp. FACHB-1515]|uniref:RecQ family ATP-dependent DNA helicase n=1 Tax=Cyanophyceae TaxID=3028117 RepID=UPI00168572E1|nr:ATP-dependent DNA helicase RecQ [Microcoleus sp. FACHB-1515]MBD2092767.1 ATP-dependent DNA helicase RecQ [Microcoleus sp. FACHB-1515]
MFSAQPSFEPTAWSHVRSTFQQIWGYEDFRPPQGEVIRALLAHQDAIVLMPTGGGKSICFQLPALLRTGLTLVVSPLVALMENQVQDLRDRRLPAALLHSEQSSYQRRQTLMAIEKQQLRLLYLSPETLFSEPVWQRLCLPHVQINGLILDEAHCLVHWGDSFRPAYRRLGAVRPALLKSKPPGSRMAIAAFTATADPQTQQQIRAALKLNSPQTICVSPYRSNLHLSVNRISTPRARRQQLLKQIKNSRETGLVYVRSRRESEQLADWLSEQGFRTAAYHAGLTGGERRSIESAWLSGTLPFVICTSAFGMGVNKPDVRWIVHFHAPALLWEYMQEIGRAGRDGKPAHALTLMSSWLDPEDRQRQRFWRDRLQLQQQKARSIAKQLPLAGNLSEAIRPLQARSIRADDVATTLALLHRSGSLEWQDPFNYQLLSTAIDSPTAAIDLSAFANSKQCRWRFLLSAFGFAQDSQWRCGHCDRCTS